MNGFGKRGNIFDMFTNLYIIGSALIVMLVFILLINGVNTSVQASSAPSQGKQFISNIQSQNAWSLDFVFVMLLFSLPMVSAVLAYFNNIPPFFFWSSIGILMLIILLANALGDAYINISTVGDMAGITSSIPMTNYIMSHFVIYVFLCCTIILFGLYMKPKNPGGYSP